MAERVPDPGASRRLHRPLMAGIGSVRLRPTPSGVGVDLTEDGAAATPTPGAALGDEGAF